MDTIFNKVSVLQDGLSHRRLPLSFPNTFLRLLLNIEQKRIPLNDNIVSCKNSRIIKDFSFFLLGLPKYLGTKLYYFIILFFFYSLRANFT